MELICGVCLNTVTHAHTGPPVSPDDSIICDNCAFWLRLIRTQDENCLVDSDFHHYMIGPEDARHTFRGFAGAKFIIEFNDGRIVSTTNLWHRGEVPQVFRERLRPNGRFLSGMARSPAASL